MNPKFIESTDWNFDAVPDAELVACCLWEYARESAFIVGLRRRSLEHWLPLFRKPQWWKQPESKQINHDLDLVRSIEHPAEVFLRGFACPPNGVLPDAPRLKAGEVHRVTGSFLRPWQTLTTVEREYRAHVRPRGLVDHVLVKPFERGIFLDAEHVVESVAKQRRLRDDAKDRARQDKRRLTDETLWRLGKLELPAICPSVVDGAGVETTVIRIRWGLFTNEEIVGEFRKWVKANRPAGVRLPDAKGRNKARDRRVALERLGMMRLLHEFRLGEMPEACSEAWRLYREREWYKERKRAGETFHRLFPFLAKSERPLSWPTKGGRGK